MDRELKTIVDNVVKSFNLVKTDMLKMNSYITDVGDNSQKMDIVHGKDISDLKKEHKKLTRDITKLKDQAKALKGEIRFIQRKIKAKKKR